MSKLRLTEEQLVEMIQQIISEKKSKRRKKRRILFVLEENPQLRLSMMFIHRHMLTDMRFKYVKVLNPVWMVKKDVQENIVRVRNKPYICNKLPENDSS